MPLDLGHTEFRDEVRDWLSRNLTAEFAAIGDGVDLTTHIDARLEWDRRLGAAGWIGLNWPKQHGGRGASIAEQLIYAEEYALARAPQRNFFGEELLGPTLIAHGTDAQRERFLPSILSGETLWCQGFSEPGAGSDLTSLSTKARLEDGEWVIDGQKVWTSLASMADWCFVLCRTEEQAGARGLSFLLCPMDQPGLDVRPIRQITGTAEFNEMFFTNARTSADLIVGERGQGWQVAMSTLGLERGTAFLGQQVRFEAELQRVIEWARRRGASANPSFRDRLARAAVELSIIKFNNYRTMTAMVRGGAPGPEASIGKLLWSRWHQRLGELQIDLLGVASMADGGEDPDIAAAQETFLFSRAHTIYAGTSEIQRNIVGERVLGLPREPR